MLKKLLENKIAIRMKRYSMSSRVNLAKHAALRISIRLIQSVNKMLPHIKLCGSIFRYII